MRSARYWTFNQEQLIYNVVPTVCWILFYGLRYIGEQDKVPDLTDLLLCGKIQTVCTCWMNAKEKSKAWWGGEHYFKGDVWKDLRRWHLSRRLSKTRKQPIQIFGERAERTERTKAQEVSVVGQERRNKASMAWVGDQEENSRKWDQRGVEMVFGVGECRSSRSLWQLLIMCKELYWVPHI